MRFALLVPVVALVPLLTNRATAQLPSHPALDTAYTPGAYRVYTGAGQPASLADIVRAMGHAQVVFLGETHDDPTGHRLELRLLQGADSAYGAPGAGASDSAGTPAPGARGARAASGATTGEARDVALSLESFERDVQLPLDEYLSGLISESSFLAAARPWPRYRTDYRPLVEFAKARGLPVIAANAPRRYVTRVVRHGRASLSDLSPQALSTLAPLPYGHASPAYRDQWIATIAEVMKQEGMKCGVPVAHPDAPVGSHQQMGNELDGQVLWDATMASSIAHFLAAHPHGLVLHVVGGFHVERGTGIPEQLRRYTPDARTLIVALRPVDSVAVFEPAPSGQWGDFVIQTDKARTLESIDCRKFRAERGLEPTSPDE